jgi:hypothetical protein
MDSATDIATIRQHIVDTHPGTSVLEAHGDLYLVHDPARDLGAADVDADGETLRHATGSRPGP